MDSRHGKMRMNAQDDRLSSLPDELIHKILSFISIKEAIKTSGLSSRWRYIWTSMPSLSFDSDGFKSLHAFSKFVKHVLSARNKQTQVHSVNLTFHGNVTQVAVKKILDYAFSHNVQRLDVIYLPPKKMEFPRCLFSSQSLKHLTLTGYYSTRCIIIPPTWELPSLVTLNISFFTLYDDNNDKRVCVFSNCANLKNLYLSNCSMEGGSNGFNICHHGLSSLTLIAVHSSVNVFTPQLKNLNMTYYNGIRSIYAPNVSSLHYKNEYDSLELPADLLYLEKADICISCPRKDKESAYKIVSLLRQIHNVKFLKVNLEVIKVLSLSVELISHQPSPFANLKSVKIYPDNVTPEAEDETQPEVTMSTEVKNYLLDSSPGATFTMTSHYEIRAVKNVASVLCLMRKLELLLDRWEISSETNMTHMEQGKAQMEGHMSTVLEQAEVENNMAHADTKVKWHFGRRMTHIKSYWGGLNGQLEKGYKNTGSIISLLQRIELVLPKLPTSHQVKLQERFFGLCAEAETIMGNVMNRMKIQCDKKPSHSNAYSDELAA